MQSVNFPLANIPLAKDQPGYQTLHVYLDRFDPTKQFATTCCLQLSDEEIEQIVKTRKAWLTQMTFGRGYNPIMMSVTSPFSAEDSESETVPADENRTSAEEWDNTHFVPADTELKPEHQAYYQIPCKNCNEREEKHYWSTRQCKV